MKKLSLTERQYRYIKNHIIESALLTEATKTEIETVQTKLRDCFNADLGPSGVDGKLGPYTARAIQKHLGITI